MRKVVSMSALACLSFGIVGCMPEKIEVVDASAVGYRMEQQPVGKVSEVSELAGAPYVRSGFFTARGVDGVHLAYRGHKDNKQYVVRDGQAGKVYDRIGAMGFSKDGRHLAYTAQEGGKWCVVLDEKSGMMFDETDVLLRSESIEGYYYYRRWLVSFTDDGKHLMYAGRLGKKWHLVVDEKLWPGFEGTIEGMPELSPDGQHVLYIVSQSIPGYPQYESKQYVFLDGKAIAECGRFIGDRPSFDKNGALEYIAEQKDGTLNRVKISPQGKKD